MEKLVLQDLVNGGFEFVSSAFLWNNVRVLVKDKEVRGYSIVTVVVFSLWGFWNLYYYPFLHQTLSFVAGISVVAANTVWVVLAYYYKHRFGGDSSDKKGARACRRGSHSHHKMRDK